MKLDNIVYYNLLTQCARIRVPVISMKTEKFKDLFRAALDRWLDSHESKKTALKRSLNFLIFIDTTGTLILAHCVKIRVPRSCL